MRKAMTCHNAARIIPFCVQEGAEQHMDRQLHQVNLKLLGSCAAY